MSMPHWMTLSAIAEAFSAFTTFIVVVRLRRNWDLGISCVRWLLWMTFVYVSFWSILRCIVYTHLSMITHPSIIKPSSIDDGWTLAKLDCIGVHAITHVTESRQVVWFEIFVCLGDAALLSISVWLAMLTYELSLLALKLMDRGAEKEASQIRVYNRIGHSFLAGILVVELTWVLVEHGYTAKVHTMLLLNYAFSVLGAVYVVLTLLFIKYKGRQFEAMHGTMVTSPVYLQLQKILYVIDLPFIIIT